MDRTKQRDIASKGGKAAHQKGTAHEWTSEEAREAGRKGGMASHRRKQAAGRASPRSDSSADAASAEPVTDPTTPARKISDDDDRPAAQCQLARLPRASLDRL